MALVFLIWTSVEVDKCFLDNWLELTVAAFHVEHAGDWHTACLPLVSWRNSVLDYSHVAGLAVGDELCGAYAERIAVVGIEVLRYSATSFITEEVVLCMEMSFEFSFFLPKTELCCNHAGNKLIGLDAGNLNVSVRVTLQAKLTSYIVRQGLEGVGVVLAEMLKDVSALVSLVEVLVFVTVFSKKVVKLGDKSSDRWYELYESFWYKHYTIVHSVGCAVGYNSCDIIYNVVKRIVVSLYFL